MNGFLDPEQLGKEGDLSGSAMPRFWSRGGEEREIPSEIAAAVRGATAGAICVGCFHSHCLLPPLAAPMADADIVGEVQGIRLANGVSTF
jgi:hypothetical protein